MALELNLYFPNQTHITVSLIDANGREETKLLNFASPASGQTDKHLRWYTEEYATQYSADLEHDNAQQIVKQLSVLGAALFDRVFKKRAALQLFKKFNDSKEPNRVLTITTTNPAILALPWELLHDSGKDGNFLSNKNISIRRRIYVANDKFFALNPRPKLHLLYVLSRPTNVSFTDPRAVAEVALQAINSTGRISVEFLRPATLKNLQARLGNSQLPPVDILHFDGHGIFDNNGQLGVEARNDFQTMPLELRQLLLELPISENTSYLLFEKDNGEKQLVPASLLANLFSRQPISLVILSTPTQPVLASYPTQNMDGIAALMAAMGVPFVLLISSSMLKPATKQLFNKFYASLAQGHNLGTALDQARLTLLEDTERREVQQFRERLKIHIFDWFVPILYQQGLDTPLLTQGQIGISHSVAKTAGSNLPAPPISGFFGRWQELWQIEHWFRNGVRCVSINSFGG